MVLCVIYMWVTTMYQYGEKGLEGYISLTSHFNVGLQNIVLLFFKMAYDIIEK